MSEKTVMNEKTAMSGNNIESNMKILTVLSRLMEYPTAELYAQREAVETIIQESPEIDVEHKQALLNFVATQWSYDLIDWQSDYDSLFDRGRSLSLLLFEHIHGESRDRGQAMIDLLNTYREAGLEVDKKELPDYIPLFLEFLSTQGQESAKQWLDDVAPIMGLLAVRLEKRDSEYAAIFNALASFCSVDIDKEHLAEQIAAEKRDDTKEALDKVWEEEMVKFGPDANSGEGCPTGQYRPSESQRRDQEVPISLVANPEQPTTINPAQIDDSIDRQAEQR